MKCFTYFDSSILSTENDMKMRLAKAWAAIDNLLITEKSSLSDEIKDIFPSSSYVDSTISMHHTQVDKAYKEKSPTEAAQEC